MTVGSRFIKEWMLRLPLLVSLALVSACASVGASGPSAKSVKHAGEQTIETSGIKVIDVTDSVARRVALAKQPMLFSEGLGAGYAEPTVIGPGDVIEISIVEAPPAVLFSNSFSGNSQLGAQSSGSVRPNTVSGGLLLPQQMIDLNGLVTVPFAGSIQAAGRTPQQIEQAIVRRLRGKAHDPQVVVRRIENASSTVTVLGEVAQPGRIPLTAKGEKLLEVIAGAGGAKNPISKTVVQITRGDRSLTLPIAQVVRDARQNIVLQPGDVVTVYFQPYSFTALGASGNNAEIPLEGTEVSLSQALGRIAGLQDNRADIRGVFVFRFEDPRAVDPSLLVGARTTSDGRIPVIYRVNLSNPSTLLVAQTFPIENKDVVYVANAPLAEFTKFSNIVTSLAFSLFNIGNVVK